MPLWLFRMAKRAALLVGVALLTFLVIRAFDSQRGAPLELWHTYVPQEMSPTALDRATWDDYLRHEERLFADVRREVTDQLPEKDRVPINRFFDGSPIYPGHFAQDWNRSYILEPDGPPVGAVVLLHGLTDSPYSLRHIARSYQERGFVVVAPRLPGHGTVPSGLTNITWPEWVAATRLAVREARRRAGEGTPLHLVGFSNGGALAMMQALDALDDPSLGRPDRVTLISPMIGITRFARFAGIAGWPAFFPAFAKAAWLAIVPEFNPFKYNSFPINGARQSYLLTDALQNNIQRHARAGRLGDLPPILTFQSVIDFTVSTRAIINALYAPLPANGSELVLFDLNRNAKLGALLRPSSEDLPTRLLPPSPRAFRTAVITNAEAGSTRMVERVVEAGGTDERVRPLSLSFPSGVFSLSHVAVPFPITDSLYGLTPDETENFGINLGAVAPRGERGALIVNLDALLRMSSNPFFPYMLERIEETTPAPPVAATGSAGAVTTPSNVVPPAATALPRVRIPRPADPGTMPADGTSNAPP